ncbi:MAG: hypothetical protein V4723_01705 [Pseudomonadota bacterium]
MRSPFRRALIAVLLALGANAAATEAVRIDDKFNPAAMAATLLKPQSDGNKTVQGLMRVAIGSFDIEFVTRGSASASETWLSPAGYSGSRPGANVMSLSGVSDADMQAIADQVHARFVRELRATGVDLVPTSQVMNTATFRKLSDAGKSAPHYKSGSHEAATVVTAEGRPVGGASMVSKGGSGSAMDGFSAIAGSLITGRELAVETQAAVINVRMVVRFVEQAGNASLFSRVSGSASDGSKISPTVVAGETRIHVFTAQGGGSFTLQAPLQLDMAAFVGVKDRMSPGSKATGVGLAVLSFALGKNDSGTMTQFDAVADPLRYRELVSNGLARVGSMMVEQLKGLRWTQK